MVYATGNNHTFCSAKPVKTKRKEGEFAKRLREFATTHRVSVQTDSSGEVIVKATKIQDR